MHQTGLREEAVEENVGYGLCTTEPWVCSVHCAPISVFNIRVHGAVEKKGWHWWVWHQRALNPHAGLSHFQTLLQDSLDSNPNLDLLQKLESSPLYFTRYRGLFRECFKGEKTDAPKGNDISKYHTNLVCSTVYLIFVLNLMSLFRSCWSSQFDLFYRFSRTLHVTSGNLVPQSQLLHPGWGGWYKGVHGREHDEDP